jgi:flagellar hook-basal body complex protein FliE
MIPAIAALASSLIQGAPSLAPTTPSPSPGVSTTSPSFTQTLGQVVSDAVGTIQNGEAAAIQGVNGDMPSFKVVEQVMGAQRTLQQAISIRDKAVSAYQEIMRMTI